MMKRQQPNLREIYELKEQKKIERESQMLIALKKVKRMVQPMKDAIQRGDVE